MIEIVGYLILTLILAPFALAALVGCVFILLAIAYPIVAVIMGLLSLK